MWFGRMIILLHLFMVVKSHAVAQSSQAVNDSIYHMLPDFLDTARVSLKWGNYLIQPDSNMCFANARERMIGERLAIYKNNIRIGEIETWSRCCKVTLRSVRIDTVVTAYSSTHGKYLSAIVSNTYDPCVVTNHTTSTDLRHWNLREIYELRDPLSGHVTPEYELANGNGYITMTDTIHRPIAKYRISYHDGYRHGFTYKSHQYKKNGPFELYQINSFNNGSEIGLFLQTEEDGAFSIGYIDFISTSNEKERRYVRIFLVDRKGKTTMYREYIQGSSKPSFKEIEHLNIISVPVCNPQELVRRLFPDADPSDYPASWGYGAKLLRCKEKEPN